MTLPRSALIGGKAANLERLRDLGWRVPEFVVLPGSDFASDGRLREETTAAHRAAIATLPGTRFAVRSSAVDEDGSDNSFAGQFLSLLDIERDAIEDAAARVFRSGRDSSVAAYRAHRGSDGDQPPSVIVQRMISPRAAGVIFSADPVTSRLDRMVISAVAGLGESLMAGEADGWTFVLDAGTGAPIEETPADGDRPLTPADIGALADAARRIAQAFGTPQDIEWAFDDAGLHILQSRPITTIETGVWRIWDNSNIVESYPGWVSPLTFSFARSVYSHVYRRLLADLGASETAIADRHAAFEGLLGRFEGRVYYELGNWHRLLSALPAYRLNAGFMDQMMGVDEPLPRTFVDALEAEEAEANRILQALRLARAGLGLAFRALFLSRTVERFRARLDDALAPGRIDFATAAPDALVAHWRDLERRLLSRWDAPLLNDLCCMIAVGLARKVLTDWGGDAGTALFNATLIGQGEIISAEPPRRILAMAAIARDRPELVAGLRDGDLAALEADPDFGPAFRAYVADFGDRCIAELKLESPTLEDDPAPVLAAVLAATGRDPHAAPPAPAQLRDVFRGKPVRGVIAGWLLRLAARRVRDRENLRFDRTRVFGRVRRIARALGDRLVVAGKLERPADIFMLTVDEVQGAVEGWGVSGDLAALATARRDAAELEQGATLPDRFETRGSVLTARPLVPRRPAAAMTGNARSGLGCSAGRITGMARVVLDPGSGTVGPGEILVARNTDPGWIALFANAAAVVVEKGSILSHSAIVAREMGIPCVVGIKGVTDWIPDGATIEVDGGAGTVRIVS